MRERSRVHVRRQGYRRIDRRKTIPFNYSSKFPIWSVDRKLRQWRVASLSKRAQAVRGLWDFHAARPSGDGRKEGRKIRCRRRRKREGRKETSRGRAKGDPGQGWWPRVSGGGGGGGGGGETTKRASERGTRRWRRRRSRAGRVPEAEPSSTAPRATPNPGNPRSSLPRHRYTLRVLSLVGYWFPRVATPMGC